MEMLPLVPELAVTIANLSATVYVYTKLLGQIHILQNEVIRLQTELLDATKNNHTEALRRKLEEDAIEIRIEALEAQIIKLETLVSENLKGINKLLEKHSDKFEQYDMQIRQFFEKYDIKPR